MSEIKRHLSDQGPDQGSIPMSPSASSDKVVPMTRTMTPSTPTIQIPQYRLGTVLTVWAAAAVPMAVLAWLVAPWLADRLSGSGIVPLAKALLIVLTTGMVWQFVLVAGLVWREQRTFRWSTVREALWLLPPTSPRSGRVGGRVWLVLIPLIVLFAAHALIPSLPSPDDRDLGGFLNSDAGQSFLGGNWVWFGLMLVMWIFNGVLGEELLFRGLLLPRMNGVFRRGDWVANGILFAVYHLHVPWLIPVNLLDTFLLSYPTKRYRSAWLGIAVHSSQSLFFAVLVLTLVLK
jgi:membrane protease YdiL (CAAX protease family)